MSRSDSAGIAQPTRTWTHINILKRFVYLYIYFSNSPALPHSSGPASDDGRCGEGGRQRGDEADGDVKGFSTSRQVRHHQVGVASRRHVGDY